MTADRATIVTAAILRIVRDRGPWLKRDHGHDLIIRADVRAAIETMLRDEFVDAAQEAINGIRPEDG